MNFEDTRDLKKLIFHVHWLASISQGYMRFFISNVSETILKPNFQSISNQINFQSNFFFRLRNDLQVEAVDGDKSGTRNSHISYEIINGNYDKKFSIDKDTGMVIVTLKRVLKYKFHLLMNEMVFCLPTVAFITISIFRSNNRERATFRVFAKRQIFVNKEEIKIWIW